MSGQPIDLQERRRRREAAKAREQDGAETAIATDAGGEASSTAIQAMMRKLIDAENPRSPLSDQRLAELLKSDGIPVARRTVAKYREAMSIPSSQDRVRIG